MSQVPVGIYSPLHTVSEHFVQRLAEDLRRSGLETRRLESRDGEVGADKTAKAKALTAHLANTRRHVRSTSPVVVAWPLMGWWEVPLWRGGARTFIALHDPEPLTQQNGLTPRAATLASKFSGSEWPQLVTMSPEASEVAKRYFAPSRIHELPHPMRQPDRHDTPASVNRILVLGQYKTARDLEVMEELGPTLRSRGWDPTVAGRGWPPVAGWTLIDRFVPEDEFQQLLRDSAAVLIPYRYYFQSGVALRALENGTPVVGRSTGFLRSLLGNEFPGSVREWSDPASWIDAIESAAHHRSAQLQSASEYASRGRDEWAQLLRSAQ